MLKLMQKLFCFQKHVGILNCFPASVSGEKFYSGSSCQSKNLYSVLGITPKATPEEIKKAYYSLSQMYHPDKRGGDKTATEKFLEIKEAHEILSDPDEKEIYDSENFPEYSKATDVGVGRRKEFKFHYYKPKNVDDLDWDTVKEFTATKVSQDLRRELKHRGGKGEKKRRARHLSMKCNYDKYDGTQKNAKYISRRAFLLCNLK